MLVLHGGWLPAQGAYAAQFAIWGEIGQIQHRAPRGRRKGSGADSRPQAHPFAATSAQLHAALAGVGEGADSGSDGQVILVRLPAVGGRPLPSPELALDGMPGGDEAPTLGTWQVESLLAAPAQVPAWLLALAGAEAATAIGPTPLVLGT